MSPRVGSEWCLREGRLMLTYAVRALQHSLLSLSLDFR